MSQLITQENSDEKATVDAKKAAANDKENGNGKKVSKRTKPAAEEKYTIGNTDTVKRGFLLEFCDFTRKKGTVDAETLVKEFSGRQIDGHKGGCRSGRSLHPVRRQQRAVQGRQEGRWAMKSKVAELLDR